MEAAINAGAQLALCARGELGVTEVPAGSNAVKYNEWYYGRAVKGAAYPWCMTFVQWVYAQAGAPLPYKTASCSALLGWYEKNDAACVVGKARPGDIVIYTFGHTGIVEDAGESYVTAIEGNTGYGNDANGGAVMRRTRPLSAVRAFIRPRTALRTESRTGEEGNTTERTERRYDAIADMPDWARGAVTRLVDSGAIAGRGGARDEDGRPADLDLSMDMLRLLVIHERMGLYG